MIGKFGISASFALIYIYSAEILPTPVRLVLQVNLFGYSNEEKTGNDS